MSATLTWASSGLGTKTGTTAATFFDDLDTLITSKAGDATFFWQKAGKSSVSTPFWLLLSRKDGSPGRILIVCWTSAPAANNAAILDTAPTTNNVYIAWFPSGNANTASNLTAASGTIAGDDTNAVKVSCAPAFSTIYAASCQHYYFDSAEGMVFGFNNPGVGGGYILGAGALVVDSADVAYGCTFASQNTANNFGNNVGSSAMFTWLSGASQAGAAGSNIRTNYGSSNRIYFQAYCPSGIWASQAVSISDIMTDTSNTKAWFAAMQLLGQTKGEGAVLKLRQIAWGPGTTSALAPYNSTGPVVAARQLCVTTTGGNGYPWMTNFKV